MTDAALTLRRGRRRGCDFVAVVGTGAGTLAYVACCVECTAPGSASSAACGSNNPPRASCGLSPMHVSAARQLALVPDVDACALSPLGVECKQVIAGAGAPPDRDLGSDAANRHPASPLVASALGAIIRGNRVGNGGSCLSCGVWAWVTVCVCVWRKRTVYFATATGTSSHTVVNDTGKNKTEMIQRC